MDIILLIQIFSDAFGGFLFGFFLRQGHFLLEQVAEIPIQPGLDNFQGIVLNTSFFQCTFNFPAKTVTLLFLHLFTTPLSETREFWYTSYFLAHKTQNPKVANLEQTGQSSGQNIRRYPKERPMKLSSSCLIISQNPFYKSWNLSKHCGLYVPSWEQLFKLPIITATP